MAEVLGVRTKNNIETADVKQLKEDTQKDRREYKRPRSAKKCTCQQTKDNDGQRSRRRLVSAGCLSDEREGRVRINWPGGEILIHGLGVLTDIQKF